MGPSQLTQPMASDVCSLHKVRVRVGTPLPQRVAPRFCQGSFVLDQPHGKSKDYADNADHDWAREEV